MIASFVKLLPKKFQVKNLWKWSCLRFFRFISKQWWSYFNNSKKTLEYYSETDYEHLAAVAKAGKMVAQKMYQALHPIGINYVSNEKSEAFQQVFHYHLHIIPKYKKEEGYGFKLNVNKEKIRDLDEIKELLTLK